MNLIMRLTIAYFDTAKVEYKKEGENMISTRVKGEKNNMVTDVILTFDDDDESSVYLRTKEYVSFGANQNAKIYEACAKANASCRWVRFYPDEENNTVIVAADALVDFDNCGDELLRLVHNICGAADEAFPNFMQVLWLE